MPLAFATNDVSVSGHAFNDRTGILYECPTRYQGHADARRLIPAPPHVSHVLERRAAADRSCAIEGQRAGGNGRLNAA